MYHNYYYPISATSLASIFGSACIYPAALYENRVNDVQSRLNEVILLTSHFGCQECDCCLEIFINDEEQEFLLDLKNGFFIYEKPIPISRIKKVHFKKASQVERTVTSIRMSTAFIPDAIVDYGDNVFSNESAAIATLPADFGTNLPSLKSHQDEFDRVLGALALMRVAHVEECNVSPHFIDTLSFFNKQIEDTKSQLGTIDTSLHKVFDSPKNSMRNTVSEQQIEETAKKENQQIVKNKITKIIDLNSLDNYSYLLAVLYTYGTENESKRKRVDELILDNFQNTKEGKEEKVAFYYGYNRGYSILGNLYQNDSNKVIVKFPMESLLDYYIIESVFNRVVFKKVSNSFDCFNWVARKNPKARKGEYIVIDTLIRDKKKIHLFSKEWWNEYLPIYLKKDDVTILGFDLTSVITERIIRPWTNFLHKELQEQLEDDKQNLTEQFAKESQILNESLASAVSENKNLQKEINDRDNYIKTLEAQTENLKNSLEEEKSNQNDKNVSVGLDADSTFTNTHQTPSERLSEDEPSNIDTIQDNIPAYEESSAEANVENNDDSSATKDITLAEMKAFAITIIDYAQMSVKDLTNLAKERKITIPKKADKKEIILMLLEPNSEQQQLEMFNQE